MVIWLKKPKAMVIKSSPWKSASLLKNHPEYSAIFNLIEKYRGKIQFILVGTTNSRTSVTSLEGDVTAWDIQTVNARGGHLTYFLELAKLLFKYRPRLVIVLGGLNVLPVAAYSILSSKCTYLSAFVGGFGYYGRRGLGRSLNKLVVKTLEVSLRLSNRKIFEILALSRSSQKDIEKLVPSLKARIRLVSYPLSSAYSSQKHVSSLLSEPAKILTVAGINPVKGLDTLIKALSLIQEDFKLTIIGSIRDPTYMDRLSMMVESFNLKDKITFITDTVDNDALASHYASSTLFILPSRDEGLPVALLEALHFNLPVVATSVGGIPDVVEDHVNGLLVKPDDPFELAKAISSLLQNDQLRRELSKNSRQRLVERYYRTRITIQEALDRSILHLLALN